jgi:hypothetical protein
MVKEAKMKRSRRNVNVRCDVARAPAKRVRTVHHRTRSSRRVCDYRSVLRTTQDVPLCHMEP